MGDVVAVEEVVALDLCDLAVDLLLGCVDVLAAADYHHYAATGCEDLSVLELCTHVVDLCVDLVEADRKNAEACFEVMRQWEEARTRKLLTSEQKEMLKDTSKEFHLDLVDGKPVLIPAGQTLKL